MNHFAVKCLSRQGTQTDAVRALASAQDNYVDSEDEDYALALEGDGSHNEDFPRKLYAHLAIENSIIKFQLDCGATVNILPSDLYIDIFGDHEYKLLKKHDTKLLMFNKTELNTIGTISVVTQQWTNSRRCNRTIQRCFYWRRQVTRRTTS